VTAAAPASFQVRAAATKVTPMSPLLDLVALSLLPIWRWRFVGEQLRAGEAPCDILDQQLALCPPSGSAQRHRFDPRTIRAGAAAAVDRAAESGLSALPWSDPAYPPALAAISDPPPVLWVRGARAILEAPAVAIVGSRAGSPYALAVAERLAGDLAERRLAIVSGLARGVDSAAHRGALAAGGLTLAVMGCGADRVYPTEHAELAREIARDGALVSELVPGTPPHSRFFPRRNRIISGLARGVVVIEAGEKSGSLITARCALEQGRDVLAVPGNILNGRNRGGHALLRDGAKIVETADDILEELGLGAFGLPAVPPGPSIHAAAPGPAQDRDPVLACLTPGESCDLDVIAERSGLSTARLLPRLFDLELQGLVRRAGGGRFVRFDRSC
jgi:DNA processing protein